MPSGQLGACLGRLTALTELDLDWSDERGKDWGDGWCKPKEDGRRPEPFPSGLFACTALRNLVLGSGGQVRQCSRLSPSAG